MNAEILCEIIITISELFVEEACGLREHFKLLSQNTLYLAAKYPGPLPI
jgi:hypothetical protein